MVALFLAEGVAACEVDAHGSLDAYELDGCCLEGVVVMTVGGFEQEGGGGDELSVFLIDALLEEVTPLLETFVTSDYLAIDDPKVALKPCGAEFFLIHLVGGEIDGLDVAPKLGADLLAGEGLELLLCHVCVSVVYRIDNKEMWGSLESNQVVARVTMSKSLRSGCGSGNVTILLHYGCRDVCGLSA